MYPIPPRPRRHAQARGYTLTELMITVAMVGVLASLAVFSFRRYADSARMSEPLATIQAIRISEEQARREGGHYVNASGSDTYYPLNSGFGDKRVPWDGNDAKAHPDYNRWKALEVAAEPVRFGYKANAGLQGQAINVTIEYKPAPVLPSPPANDWYIIQAKGSPTLDGKTTMLISASFAADPVYIQEDAP